MEDLVFVGGIRIDPQLISTNRMEFNTLVGNQAKDTAGSSITCFPVPPPGPPADPPKFNAPNNIMWSNLRETGGDCTYNPSVTMDPMLDSTFHLQPGSPAIGKADPNSLIDDLSRQDFDGHPRMNPADIGADEVP
jgi:hypothetical protein